MHDLSCDEVHDRAPSFALDILEPAARADVAAHLLRCPLCAREVTGMQESAAELLDLRDPDGWDLGDWDDPHPAARSRRRLRVAAALTAATVLLVASALGPELEQAHGGRAAVPVASASLLSGAAPVGSAYFYAGPSPAVVLRIDGLSVPGHLTCVLVETDGTEVRMGQFKLFGGKAVWAAADHVPVAQTASVVLQDGTGLPVAAASLGS